MSAAVANNVVVAISSRADYARCIRERLMESVQAVLDVGKMLTAAKAALPHGDFQAMVREDLGWSPRTAQRFMAIARHPVLSNATHVSHLPASWSALAELARVEPKRLEAAIADGTVRPDMPRTATNRIVNEQKFREWQFSERPQRAASSPPPPTPPTPWEALRAIVMSVGELFVQLETLHTDAVHTLCDLPLAPDDRRHADALDALAMALERARDEIGARYDDLAGMTNLPTREQA